MLEVRSLTKRFRGTTAVQDLSFTIAPGQILGCLGPNGSGKSTTVKMLTGLLDPSAGQILWNGRNVNLDWPHFKRLLGYVPEELFLYPHLTGLEYLALIGRLRELDERKLRHRAESLLELFLLKEARHTYLSAYSKGMRQRIMIAAALLDNPDLLILDEPFSGLDVNAGLLFRTLLETFAAEGKLILFSSHVLEIVEKICSDVFILHQGHVVAQGSIASLRELRSSTSLEQVFAQVTGQPDYQSAARAILSTVQST